MTGTLQRCGDWASRLELYLQACDRRKFRYGQLDCCLFVCDAVQVMTGIDLAAWFRFRYRTRREAHELMRKFAGGPSVQAVVRRVADEYRLDSVAPAFAQRGDMVLVRRANRTYSLGLLAMNGRDVLVAVWPQGVQRMPLSFAVEAWHT